MKETKYSKKYFNLRRAELEVAYNAIKSDWQDLMTSKKSDVWIDPDIACFFVRALSMTCNCSPVNR